MAYSGTFYQVDHVGPPNGPRQGVFKTLIYQRLDHRTTWTTLKKTFPVLAGNWVILTLHSKSKPIGKPKVKSLT
ncbi:hypothetical protein A8704_11565 [Lactiplantibacillus plantarum]|nr:hypothetical protein A8704_11565 [Lactiplantibacillus plantarum]